MAHPYRPGIDVHPSSPCNLRSPPGHLHGTFSQPSPAPPIHSHPNPLSNYEIQISIMTIHHSLFTTHDSRLTTHDSQLTNYLTTPATPFLIQCLHTINGDTHAGKTHYSLP